MAKIKIGKQNKKPSELEIKIATLEDNYKRALADYQNLERSIVTRVQSKMVFEKKILFASLLSLLDDLERASQHLDDKGIAMIVQQFHSTLKNEGVEVITSDDQPFDPLTMECTDKVTGPKDVVINTLTKGYKFSDTVLRVAQVTVGNGQDSKSKN